MGESADKAKEPSLWILLLLVSFASISAVLFTPSLPELTQKLQITPSEAQFTITIFLVGYALGNLPYGPLANYLGRKSAIYVGIMLALAGSALIVLVAFVGLFWLFILGRFLLALGSSVGITLAYTIIGDIYKKKALTKKISYFMLVFAIGPSASVALGGFLTAHFGWVSCFYFLIAYSLFLLIATSYLPETIKKLDRDALILKKIREGYCAKLKNKTLITASVLMGLGSSTIYLFASEAPFVGISYIGLTPEAYGLLNFIPPAGMIVGSILVNILAGKKEPFSVILLGIFIALSSSLVMLGLFLLGSISLWSLFLPMPFIYIGDTLVFSNASSFAMTYARNKSNGSAVMNCINLAMCVLILLAVEALASHHLLVMPITFATVFFLMFFMRKYLSHVMSHS